MTSTLRQSLMDALLAAGAANADEAAALADIKEPGVSWINAVLNTGKVDETRLLTRLGETFRTPFEPQFDATRIERATLSLFPSRFVFQHHIVPLEHTESGLKLATYDLFNTAGRQIAVQLTGGKPVRWVLASRAQILRAIKSLYGVGAETFDELLKARGSNADDLFTDRELISDINANDPEASVVKFVNQIIREAIAERATDIHVEPLENDLRIRYRIDGILHEAAVPQQLRVLQNAIISRLKVMARMDIAEKRLPQDGRINLVAGDTSIDVRVSTIPTVNGESISLRLLSSRDRQSFGFERLDLDEAQTKMVKALLAMPNGIVLVTGPTGSGKSTTLYSFLSSINSVQRRIITIEEPVEYSITGSVADRRQAGDRTELREWIAAYFAAGSERHHGGRDPRYGDRGYRDPGGVDGPSGVQHAAHERRGGRDHASDGYGNRAVSAFEYGAGVFGATIGADDLPPVRGVGGVSGAAIGRDEVSDGPGHKILAGDGLRPLPANGLPGAHGDPRDLCGDGAFAQAGGGEGERWSVEVRGDPRRDEDAAARRLAPRRGRPHDN